MSIEGIAQVSSRGGRTRTADDQVMGKTDFLHMLVAQLKSQDPLNPMDSTAFTAQLAQFSSLEQLQNINTTLTSIGGAQYMLTNNQAVGFIGKTITAFGNSFEIKDGQPQPIPMSFSRASYGSYLKIYDSSGNFIRQIESGPLPAGDHLTAKSPDGVYRFEVVAIDENGNAVPVTPYASGVVSGVNFKNGQAYLQFGNQEIPMMNVVRVGE
jgi:flagellar basal-body rod modification protein FlgD